jgi:gamma-glutamyl-gamma-aminobutyrate hydrolase PuuD
MTRESEGTETGFHPARMQFERQALRQAMLQGRPVVALCAGSWQLWQAAGGQLTEVADHNYGGGMPRVQPSGKVGYNKQIHDVVVDEFSLLRVAMGLGQSAAARRLGVNSIHWKAPSESNIPRNFQVVARSEANQSLQIKTRQGNLMQPQSGTVEAFESCHGAPMIGFAWHPEAYDWSSESPEERPHTRVLQYMAKAGTTYQLKQTLNAEFQSKVSKVTHNTLEGLSNAFKKLHVA